MIDGRSIKTEISDLNTLQLVTRAFTEIAAVRMRKTKNSVVLNRQFLQELDDVFSDVRASYARELIRLGQKSRNKSEEGITFLAHNGKTVAVFLSANTGLYGDIIQRTSKTFLEEVRRSPEKTEVAIVGSLGMAMFKNEMPNHPFTFFEMSDTNITPSTIAQLIEHIVQYEEIQVYYPVFQSAVRQEPSRYTISAETPLTELKTQQGRKDRYIFEPGLKDILMFFERETFSSLMDQSIREAQLAKYAARIMTLDRSGENIKHKLKKLRLDKLKVEHRQKNKKQIELMSSITMW